MVGVKFNGQQNIEQTCIIKYFHIRKVYKKVIAFENITLSESCDQEFSSI